MNNELSTITFPQNTNSQILREAVLKALSDDDFMGNIKKVRAAAEALIPKDTLTATLKRLQGNANKDFLDKKDKGVIGFVDEARSAKIRSYVQDRFQSYMDDHKTADKASKLFNEAYAVKEEDKTPDEVTGQDE